METDGQTRENPILRDLIIETVMMMVKWEREWWNNTVGQFRQAVGIHSKKVKGVLRWR